MKIKEGKVVLEIPKFLDKQSFYNPKMEFSRNLTVLFVHSLKKQVKVCDALCAIGARGIRIGKESENVEELWLNDYSKEAVKYCKLNVSLNKLNCKTLILNKDACVLLNEQKRYFDYIDIDPFGSPIYYLDALSKGIKRHGYFGVSATDTQALSGYKPKACFRRYGIKAFPTDLKHEIGVRNLLGAMAFILARYLLSLKPLFSFYKEHYYRIFVEVEKSKIKTNKCLENLGYVLYCKKCLNRKFGKDLEETCSCGEKFDFLGLTWIGELSAKDFVEKLKKNLEKFYWFKEFAQAQKLLETISQEINFPSYDLHYLAKFYKLKRLPKLDWLFSKLEEIGYEVSRTHFSPTCFKTSAPLQIILKFLNPF